MESGEHNVSKGEKSPLYPSVTIEECIEFIRLVDSLGGKVVSYDSVLDAMGLKSRSTKSFLFRVSTSKQYGFIETSRGSTIQLTDLARHILYPVEEESAELLIRQSFKTPPMYSRLVERFEGKSVPQKVQLGNILMNEYRVVKSVKDNAAQCFIESAQYLGIIKNGVLCYEETLIDEPVTSANSEPEQHQSPSTISAGATQQAPNESSELSTGDYSFEIPTLNGRSVKIIIPGNINAKDVDFINLYVEKMLPEFLNNVKELVEKKDPEQIE